jgi:hypothetical protein
MEIIKLIYSIVQWPGSRNRSCLCQPRAVAAKNVVSAALIAWWLVLKR